MGGKLGLVGRVALAFAVVSVFVFVAADPGGADPVSYTVSIGNATGSSPEGDAPGANTLSFPLTVSPSAAPDDIVVTYTSSEGIVSSFTIPANTQSINMPVGINGNTTPEDDRKLTVDLTGVAFATDQDDTVATGGTTEGTGSIVDDDWRIAGLTSDPANASASESGGTIDFKVTLASGSAPANHKLTVDYTVADGGGSAGAVRNQDYKITQPSNGNASGTLTFAPGTNAVDVKVQGLDDQAYGYDKQFTVTFSNPKGASFSAGATTAATGTITESSAAPIVGISTNCGTVTGGANATIGIRSSYASPIPAKVTWTTTDGSATSGDYNGGTGTATIPAGSRDGTITIPTNANPPAGDRTFTVTISNPQQATLLSTATTTTCTVHQPANVGADKIPTISYADPAPVTQPAAGAAPVTVTMKVTLNAPVSTPAKPAKVDLAWKTVDGSAVAPDDYKADSGTLHWDPGVYGAKTFTLTVNPTNGKANEPITFTIQFQSADANFVGSSTSTVTVVPPTSPPAIAVGDASVLESAGAVGVVVSAAPTPTGTVTVKYATSDGTAKAGSDYSAVSGTLTFSAGQASKTISIPIANNTVVDGNRTFTFTLSSPTGATITDATATITIRNDDLPPAPAPVAGAVPTGTGNGPPTQIVQKQPAGNKHAVLVQIVSALGPVDGKGYLHYTMRCPAPAVRRCQGTIVLEVRMSVKLKSGKHVLKTIAVATGKFTLTVNRSVRVKLKVTKTGLALLQKYRRMQVKATIHAKDAQNVKGVTAYLVTLQAPARQITIKTP